jgi:hypothetical protein
MLPSTFVNVIAKYAMSNGIRAKDCMQSARITISRESDNTRSTRARRVWKPRFQRNADPAPPLDQTEKQEHIRAVSRPAAKT